MTKSKIKTDAQAILHVMQTLGIPAVVAGGCIRDDVLGLPAKDIDVFTAHITYEDFCADAMRVAHALLEMGHAVYASIWAKNESYQETEQVGLRYYLYIADLTVDGIQYQLISDYQHFGGGEPSIIERGKSLVERFDAGILQAFWVVDDDNTYSTVAFQHDVSCKRYTLMVAKTEEASIERYMRFNSRHPGVLRLSNPFYKPDA